MSADETEPLLADRRRLRDALAASASFSSINVSPRNRLELDDEIYPDTEVRAVEISTTISSQAVYNQVISVFISVKKW